MTIQRDIDVPGGRTVRFWDTGPVTAAADGTTMIWHHGTPQTGRLLGPVVNAATTRGIRVVSCARAGYAGTTELPGRTVSDAAADVVAVAHALGLRRYATVGSSGGGPHALACAALDPERVTGVLTFAGIAPHTDAYDWFAGMISPGALTAALYGGREARRHYGETHEFDVESFVDTDWAALKKTWGPIGVDANRASVEATENGAPPWAAIDDDVAFTRPWGFELSSVGCPTLIVQGGRDRVVPRAHGERMVEHLPSGQLWLRPADGHVAVLDALPVALDWLLDATAGAESEQ